MATENYQIKFTNHKGVSLTIGDGTPYEIDSIDGLDDFDVRDNDFNMPSLWGAYPGRDLPNQRTVIIKVDMVTDQTLLYNLESVFTPTEDPNAMGTMEWKFPERQSLWARARCRRRKRGARTNMTEISTTGVAIQMVAPDPRRYSSVLHTQILPPFLAGTEVLEFVGTGGDAYLDFAASGGSIEFTGIAGSGFMVIRNEGNVDTYPLITFAGPLSGSALQYSITNITTGDVVRFSQPLSPAESLIVDISVLGTGKTGMAVNYLGFSRYNTWIPPRRPLRIAPGDNFVKFEAEAGSAVGMVAKLDWRDAYL